MFKYLAVSSAVSQPIWEPRNSCQLRVNSKTQNANTFHVKLLKFNTINVALTQNIVTYSFSMLTLRTDIAA